MWKGTVCFLTLHNISIPGAMQRPEFPTSVEVFSCLLWRQNKRRDHLRKLNSKVLIPDTLW